MQDGVANSGQMVMATENVILGPLITVLVLGFIVVSIVILVKWLNKRKLMKAK